MVIEKDIRVLVTAIGTINGSAVIEDLRKAPVSSIYYRGE